MRFVRPLAAFAIASSAIALASCTTLLGDFTVGTTTGDDAATDATNGDVQVMDSSPDTSMQETSTGDASDASEAGMDACSGLVCSGACVPNDTRNCGTCGHDCTNLAHVIGVVTCRTGGVCAFPTNGCAPGFADCNNMPDDGCETDLSKPAHCGTCTTTCSGGTPVCTGSGDAGTTFSCVSGCPSNMPTLCSGSCVDVNTNAQNCSTCGRVCANVANGQPGCTGGACGIGACNANFQDCNMLASDGCEVNTQTDRNHCGSCTNACNLPNAVPACTGGACTIASCNAGFGDCNNIASDGCEANINTDSMHCGSACVACTGGRTCQAGTCACPPGTTLCGMTCVNVSTDANNCKVCGRSCQGGACSSGVCQPTQVVNNSQVASTGDFATDGTVLTWVDGNQIAEVTSMPAGPKVVLGGGTLVQNIRGLAISMTGNANIEWLSFDGTATLQMVSARSGVAMSGAVGWTGSGISNGLVFDSTGTTVWWERLLAGNLYLLNCNINGPCYSARSNASNQGSYDLAFGGGKIVYGDQTNGNLFVFDITNSTTITIAGQTNVARTAADTAYAYWQGGSSGNAISRAPFGSATAMAVGTGGGGPIETDGTYLYFVSGANIVYMPVGGGTASTLVPLATAPNRIRLAAGAIYYDNGGGYWRVKTP